MTTTVLAKVEAKDMTTSVSHLRSFITQEAKILLAAMPDTMSVERFIAVCVSEFTQNPDLMKCTPASIINAIKEAAQLGLEINGVLGHAYLVPYKTKCQLLPGYRGLIDLVRRTAQISTLTMENVYRGDKFDYALGDDGYIRHRPDESDAADFSDDKITHTYVVVKMRDGGLQRKVWTRKRVEQHRDKYSPGRHKKDSPWNTAFGTMAKKTVVRDMIARGELPVSVEAAAIALREEYHDFQTATQPVPTSPVVSSIDDLTRNIEAPKNVVEEAPPEKPKRSRKPKPKPKPKDEPKESKEVDPKDNIESNGDGAWKERLDLALEDCDSKPGVDSVKELFIAGHVGNDESLQYIARRCMKRVAELL